MQKEQASCHQPSRHVYSAVTVSLLQFCVLPLLVLWFLLYVVFNSRKHLELHFAKCCQYGAASLQVVGMVAVRRVSRYANTTEKEKNWPDGNEKGGGGVEEKGGEGEKISLLSFLIFCFLWTFTVELQKRKQIYRFDFTAERCEVTTGKMVI